MAQVIQLFKTPKQQTISRVFVTSPLGRAGCWLHADDLIRWIAESEIPEDWRVPIVEALEKVKQK